ncbi:MAG: dienelactone hydrolase family protein [Burkholderiales bacterium]|jgi:carboxymethylenebutenolidase|nr:dienelactone hydrolase family protein [Burkholderiales bacterium]
MTRQTAQDFHPEVLKLFDKYIHGIITRRGFLDSAQQYAVGGVTAAGLLGALSPSFAAPVVAPADPRIKASMVEFPSPEGNGKVRGYLAKPAQAKGKLPAILVVHENRGLNPHIEDIARRLALLNFIAFAPDGLAPQGGYPGDEEKAEGMFAKADQSKMRADFVAGARALKTLPDGTGKVGVIGFCYGGGVANYIATRLPDLNAAVVFYGPQPPVDEAARIKAPLQLHYAGEDERVNSGWPAFEAALKAAGVKYEAFTYPKVQHAFNNDTTPRYDAAAAALAWRRAVEFFEKNLRG